MANKIKGGKFFHKRRGGGWRRRRRRSAWARHGSGSDGTSDEDYVVTEEEEDDDDDRSSYSYSTDAFREDASQSAESTSCTEEDEDDDDDEEEEGDYDVSEPEAARGRRIRKTPAPAGSGRKRKAKPSRRRRSRASWLVDEVEEKVDHSPIRKPRGGPRRRLKVSAEDEEEYEDDDDEDFTPGDEDDDGEQLAVSPVRKTGGRKKGPVKRQRRADRPGNSKKGKKKKAPVRKRRRRMDPSSDEDFVVDDNLFVEGIKGKSKRSSRKKRGAKRPRTTSISDDDVYVVEDRVLTERTRGKKKSVSKGKKRRQRATCPGTSDSDFEYTISEEEWRDLQIRGPSDSREQKILSSAARGEEKRRGKEIDDSGKQICGICLSEEQKGSIRGLLDSCAHYFCFACIMEWSKVESRCPLCKQRFKTIGQSARSSDGLSLRAVVKRIPKRDQVYQPSEEEVRNYLDPYATMVCMECQRGGNDHLMLLCDICDSPAHTYCVGLGREVPEGNWYCDGCRSLDPGSSNSHVLDSMVEHRPGNGDLLQSTYGENESENATNCRPHDTLQQSATLSSPRQSVIGVGEGASSGYHSSLGDHGTPSPASGFTASTLLGRRSIHQHIRTMLSNNRVRWMPEGVARNVVTQPSHVEGNMCSSEVQMPGETLHCQKESPIHGISGTNSRPSLTSRVNMHSCSHNEASSFSTLEGAKVQVQSMVKHHLKCLTRDNPLEHRLFKDIARRATHTILAGCGAEHNGRMVAMPVGQPPSCAHQADGEPSGVVKDCCSACFASFASSVVRRLVDLQLLST